MIEYKSNPSLDNDFKETENHYFDTSCQKCGHVPQGETHLCGWEHDGTLHFRKLEHMQKPLTAEQVLKGTEPNELTAILDMETPKENWKTEIVKKFFVYNLVTQTPAGAEKELLEYIDTLLLTQRQEIVEMIEDLKKSNGHTMTMNGEYAIPHNNISYQQALSDLSERIEKGA